MAGRIEKRGNSYRLIAYGGYDINGKQLVYKKTVKGITEKQAEKLLAEFITRVDHGQVTTIGKLKIKDFAERWFKEYCEKRLAPKTQQTYRLHLEKRILPALGHIDISKLTPTQIMSFLNNLAEPGLRLDGKKGILSPSAILYCYRVLSSMLHDAVEWQILIANPCDRVKPPAVKKRQAKGFTKEQAQIIIECLAKEELKYQVAVMLALSTGVRLGELVGLEWKDVNFDEKYLTVVRSSQSIPGRGTFAKIPKNDSSCRRITLPTSIVALLKDYKAQQDAVRLKLGDKWKDCDRLFTQWNGEPMYTQTPSQWFSKFLKHHNLPHVPFNGLRHTSASLLIAQGIPLKNVSTRLGHTDIRTTANIYSHALQSVDQQIADSMDDFLTRNQEIDKQK